MDRWLIIKIRMLIHKLNLANFLLLVIVVWGLFMGLPRHPQDAVISCNLVDGTEIEWNYSMPRLASGYKQDGVFLHASRFDVATDSATSIFIAIADSVPADRDHFSPYEKPDIVIERCGITGDRAVVFEIDPFIDGELTYNNNCVRFDLRPLPSLTDDRTFIHSKIMKPKGAEIKIFSEIIGPPVLDVSTLKPLLHTTLAGHPELVQFMAHRTRYVSRNRVIGIEVSSAAPEDTSFRGVFLQVWQVSSLRITIPVHRFRAFYASEINVKTPIASTPVTLNQEIKASFTKGTPAQLEINEHKIRVQGHALALTAGGHSLLPRAFSCWSRICQAIFWAVIGFLMSIVLGEPITRLLKTPIAQMFKQKHSKKNQ